MTNVYADYTTAGEEVSSTYEGRHVTLLESELTHTSHTDGFVNKGDPVRAGNIVGVALKSGAAATDLIPIDTEGIWALTVTPDAGGMSLGANIFADSSSAALSATSSGAFFGHALKAIAGSSAAVIPVKVHGGE